MTEREKAITLPIDHIEALLDCAMPVNQEQADAIAAVAREVEQVRAMPALPSAGDPQG